MPKPPTVLTGEQSKAHEAVMGAVLGGVLPPAACRPCLDCGGPAHVYHHPRGYAPEQRLDVEPLCHSCHGKRHARPRSGGVTFSLRVSPDWYALLMATAEREGRTFGEQMFAVLEAWGAQEEEALERRRVSDPVKQTRL